MADLMKQMKQLGFISVAIVFVLSLFVVGASLQSRGHLYLVVADVAVCGSGLVLAILPLRIHG